MNGASLIAAINLCATYMGCDARYVRVEQVELDEFRIWNPVSRSAYLVRFASSPGMVQDNWVVSLVT